MRARWTQLLAYETGGYGKRELEAVEMSLLVKTNARVIGKGACERAEDVPS